MTNLKKILTDIADTLEELATTIAAQEAALIDNGTLTAQDVDRRMDRTKAKHGLVNLRHWIASLPD
jgi:hypothetical protein